MGGQPSEGLSALQLHKAINNRVERVTPDFLSELADLLKEVRITETEGNRPLITEQNTDFQPRMTRVVEYHS